MDTLVLIPHEARQMPGELTRRSNDRGKIINRSCRERNAERHPLSIPGRGGGAEPPGRPGAAWKHAWGRPPLEEAGGRGLVSPSIGSTGDIY